MTQQERSIETAPPTLIAGPPAPAGDWLAAKAAGDQFLDAGDDAIRKALDGDASQFNAAMEQEGGQ